MSAEWTERVAQAAGQVEVSWSPERAAQVLRGVHRQKRRQTRLRGLGVVATVLVLAGLSPRLVSWLRGSRGSGPPVASAPPPGPGERLPSEPPPLYLRDGSLARPQGPTSQVRVREDRPGRTVVELSGAAQFEVVHDPLRLFRVETHGLAVEVLGTRFFVAEQGPRVRVTVQQGRVRVLWASHYDELGAGQSALFLPEPAIASAAPPPPPPPLHEPGPGLASPGPTVMAPAEPVGPPRRMGIRPPRRERPAPTGSAAPQPAGALGTPPAEPGPASWQTLAHEGQFEQAYRLAYGPTATHRAAEPPLLHERALAPGELLLLADVARLSHHPTDAVAPLSRLLREHAEDPRAPLAAFTLGRVLLDELGRPREAAQSFGQVQRLDPEGPLSQDALAREVEAWSRAGEAASARACAQQYLQKYPTGRRLRSVRHFGELW